MPASSKSFPCFVLFLKRKEIDLKHELRSRKENKGVRIYREVNAQPEEREFSSVLTTREMAEQQAGETPQYSYHRLPMPEEKSPEEKVNIS